MKNPEESKTEAAIRAIVDVLADDKLSEKTRLTVLRGFKLTLNKGVSTLETKFNNGCDIESLFDAVSLADSEGNLNDDNLRTEYFQFLLNGTWDPELHDKIRFQLVKFLKSGTVCNSLVSELWDVLERNYLIWPDVIQEALPYSKFFMEEKIFSWIRRYTETESNLENFGVRYYAELSVHSGRFFCMFTALFNEFVILTKGNDKVLQLVHYFTSLVCQICDVNGKSVYELYPRSVSHIIPFLSISPAFFSECSTIRSIDVYYRTKVLQLLLSAFQSDKKNILLLLTHYPEWLAEFAAFFKDNRR